MPSRQLQFRLGGQRMCKSCCNFEIECVAFFHYLETHRKGSQLNLQPSERTLFNTFAELQESARQGCDICLVWNKAIINECNSENDEKALLASQDPVRMQPPSVRTPTTKADGYRIEILSPKRTCVKLVAKHLGKTLDAKISSFPGSDGVWQEVTDWLRSCKSSHDSCRQRVDYTLPTRLVHVPDDNIVRVHDTGKLSRLQNLDYIALSYAWGGDQAIQLTAQREPELRNGIAQSEFPKTLRDTFRVCRKLGIPYVWIDALCIRQGDGGLDFQQESERMDKIYGFASVTILATSAQSAQEGFLLSRKLEDHPVKSKRMQFADGKLMIQRKGLTEVRARSPVALRGWCFQEELLSKRILYCTSHGVFWSCAETQWAEHKNPDGDDQELAKSTLPISVLDPHFFITSPDWLHIWDQLVDQYSIRDVSQAKDRLPAVIGLAKSIEQRTGEEFLYGMWRSRLPVQLLWITLDMKRTVAHRAGPASIPSWSWASTPPLQAVRMPPPEISYARAKLLDVQRSKQCLELQGRTRHLLAGHDKLDAWPVKNAISVGSKREFEDTDVEAKLWAATATEIFIREEGRDPVVIQLDGGLPVRYDQLVCFEINYKGLLLLEVVSKAKSGRIVYRRVGCCQLHDDAAFFALSEVETIALV